MSRPAIAVESLSKAYRIEHLAPGISVRDRFIQTIGSQFGRSSSRTGTTYETFWALNDVSFEIRPGEVVGILGRNGAGKSTLLKILSRITEPTRGTARIRGRLASLLEVGTGFHHELTGRENIYLNGSILGMKKAEIDRNFDEIVAFAEIERFIDTQVKHYSTGMAVRLAFAIGAQLEGEILIVDEVLAVGDFGFQKKCLGRLNEVTQQGRTVLFVSHSMPAIQNLCTRCILLERGRMVRDGKPADVLAFYNQTLEDLVPTDRDLSQHPGRTSGSIPLLKRASITSRDGNSGLFRMGDPLQVEIEFQSPDPLTDVFCRVNVKNSFGAPIFGLDSDVNPPEVLPSSFRGGILRCDVDSLPLMPGTYSVDLHFGSRRMVSDAVHDACRFEVHPADYFGSGKLPLEAAGSVAIRSEWGFFPAPSEMVAPGVSCPTER